MTSLPSPEVRTARLSRIAVAFPIADLGIRRSAEDRFQQVNSGRQVQFVPSYTIMFPGRTYDNREIDSIVTANNIDGVILVQLVNVGSTTARMPTQTTAQCTGWSMNQGCTRATATTTGGYDVSKPYAGFTVTLYAAQTGRAIWVATATTSGSAFSSGEGLLRSLAEKTVRQLVKDGVVR